MALGVMVLVAAYLIALSVIVSALSALFRTSVYVYATIGGGRRLWMRRCWRKPSDRKTGGRRIAHFGPVLLAGTRVYGFVTAPVEKRGKLLAETPHFALPKGAQQG
jgi:hypothetical protein